MLAYMDRLTHQERVYAALRLLPLNRRLAKLSVPSSMSARSWSPEDRKCADVFGLTLDRISGTLPELFRKQCAIRSWTYLWDASSISPILEKGFFFKWHVKRHLKSRTGDEFDVVVAN